MHHDHDPSIIHDHTGHHHHNKRGNDLYCPDDNCFVGLINSGLANFFKGSDIASAYQFGGRDHNHDKPAEHVHDWQPNDDTNDFDYRCACGTYSRDFTADHVGTYTIDGCDLARHDGPFRSATIEINPNIPA